MKSNKFNQYNYAVFVGPYKQTFLGCTETLHAAKLLATRNIDAYYGKQIVSKVYDPEIYRIEDVEKTDDGYMPNPARLPVCTKFDGKWYGRD